MRGVVFCILVAVESEFAEFRCRIAEVVHNRGGYVVPRDIKRLPSPHHFSVLSNAFEERGEIIGVPFLVSIYDVYVKERFTTALQSTACVRHE